MNNTLPIVEVADDIYLLSLPVPLMHQVNCYLFRGENGFTLIDTGVYIKEGIEIWESLMSSGMIIEKVVLTHFHLDHIGFARWFQEKHHIPVYISHLGYQEMKKRREGDYSDWVFSVFEEHDGFRVYRAAIEEQIALETQLSDIYDFEPDGILNPKQMIRIGNESYETIWTPGHSFDHFCFYNQEKKCMVTGDHILEKISPIVLIESRADVNPLMNYFDSLEKVKDYHVEIALPGHGRVMKQINNRIAEIKSGHDYRMKQMIQSLNSGGKTAGQLTEEVYKKGYNKFAYGPIMSTIVRCIYLESIGRLKSKCINGKRIYELTCE